MKWLAFLMVSLIVSCRSNGRTESYDEELETSIQTDERELWQMQDRRIQPGCFAPKINMPLLFRGEQDKVSDTTRHVVLFWASWCKDCKAETAAILEIQRSHPTLPWVTVSLDNEAAKAREYIHDKKVKGTHYFDGRDWRGEASTDFAVPLHGIPYIILIDKYGKIEWVGGEVSELKRFLDHHDSTGSHSPL